MTNEELVKIVQRGEQAALLIGQIHGKIHNILNLESPVTNSETRHHLIDLFHFITESTAELYYKPNLEHERVHDE